ncbi:hypothetical protein niasHT_020342 [Heterodera trifolii]|uniref:Major facilitator superfamily (MFS) profile domain-containing protein n=1 Tax=Heterodera trifolii TaxID=157864 RepID=A0ABD2JX23_9BILA
MEKSRLLYVVLFHTVFASFGEIEANLLNYLTVPVRQFFADSLLQRYGIAPYSSQFEFVYSMVASIFFIGAIFGGAIMGPCMEHFGRRATAVYLRSFLGAFSAICMLLSKWLTIIELFAIGHFIAGVIAAWKIAMFIYLAECAPDHSRGWSTSLIGSGSTLALLLMASLCLPSVFGNDQLWWLLPAFALFLSIFHLCFAAHFPESPKHLFCGDRRNKTAENCHERAKLSIKFYHGSAADVFKVMNQFEQEQQLLTSREHFRWSDFWKIPELRHSLCITLLTSWVFAFSLTNLKSQYLESMLMRYGLTQTGAMVSTMAMIAVTAPFCFLSPVLIERWGRRPLFLLVTSFSVAELALITGAQFASDQTASGGNDATAALALIGFTLGQSSANLGILHMTPILIGELIPHAARSATIQVNLLFASPLFIFIVIAYPPLIGTWGALFFMPMALISAVLLFLLYRWMPETKGLSVNTIFRRMAKLGLLNSSSEGSTTSINGDGYDDEETEALILKN